MAARVTRWLAAAISVFVVVALNATLLERVSDLDRNALALRAEVESLEEQVAAIELSEGEWPLTVDLPGRAPVTFTDAESLACFLLHNDVSQGEFMYALERDIHRNPALGYWLAETHASIDGENDPLPFMTHSELMRAQARSWDREPYLTFPYQVEYPGGED